jgi:hypothetical protein
MFEQSSARELIDVITARARTSATAEAEKYAAIAELERRRLRDGVELANAAADATDGTAAEVSAALNIGHGRAIAEIDVAMMLATKFPEINAVYLQGLVTARRIWLLEKHTDLLVDPAAIAQLDRVLADRIIGWGPLSEWKFEQLVDAEIGLIDPAAVHKVKEKVRDRDFTVGRRDGTGTVAYWGRMTEPDAACSVKQIRRMTRMVCPDDPRTLAQRRGDAHAALMAGSTVLACRCDNPDCPAAAVEDAAAAHTIIHVITDQATLDQLTAADIGDGLHGPRSVEGELGEMIDEVEEDAQHEDDTRTDPVEEPSVPDDSDHDEPPVPDHDTATDRPDPDEPLPGEPPVPDPADEPGAAEPPRPVAFIDGYGVIPPTLLADLITRGATVKPLEIPGADAEPRYRPSAALDRFVRMRDLTCRAPGCDKPAEYADVDHTVPYPAGRTHAGGLKCDCRKHHLIKTFHTGWSEKQLPDGTVVFTTPTGHTYTTKPAIALLFPQWNISTPAPPAGPAPPPGDHRSMKMPKRQRTRAQTKAARINAERAQHGRDDEPPPF